MRQVELVADRLRQAQPGLVIEVTPIVTTGDRVLDTPLPLIGGKGLFTSEIERALLDGRIDLAVHSLKDLPTNEVAGIVIGAIPERADPGDVIIPRAGEGLAGLPLNARIGTSSPRRAAQLRRYRADFQPVSIRGNIETRLRKGNEHANGFNAVVLAAAGLDRLGLAPAGAARLPFEVMLPAPGQGALAVQCRPESWIQDIVGAIDHRPTAFAVAAERAFLDRLGGGCSAPVAALAQLDGEIVRMSGRVLSLDGSESVDVERSARLGDRAAAAELGVGLAELAISHGAASIVELRS